ncbi:S28 family serine protease [Microbulbifer taiwanensis]|uniref:S28 family serine protease n=1 Tax=Microbulbifer taiwanensis TaxID=986746 RepID=A0ABW1YW78_9GAMM|nr:S28 family serine protease [Microbulbifer taiwanensis]
MRNLHRILFFCCTLLLTSCDTPRQTASQSLYQRLNQLPGVEVARVKSLDGFTQGYQLWVEQPLDHQNPAAGSFRQKVYLSHLDSAQPVILETEGYWVRDFPQKELADILRANLLAVEYRFYGDSLNEGEIPWQYLTVEQAAADHHRIVELFKPIYSGPWVSSGFSKGGESALIHRRYYPHDVQATVVYDAPLILGTEDTRVDSFIRDRIDSSGQCGRELVRFQRELLERRAELIPELQARASANELTFSIGESKVLEYAALEYTFSFWQRGQTCDEIPPKGAAPEQMLDHIEEGGGYWVYSDQGIEALEPSMYQHHTQLGYYGFMTQDLVDLLQVAPEPSNLEFAPKEVAIEFDAKFTPNLIEWLQHNGHNTLYLYGERDPWYAGAVDHGKITNAFTLVQKDGHHLSRIRQLSEEQRERAYDALSRWLQRPVNRG